MAGILKRCWAGWLRVTEVLGTIQMVVLLSLVYWAMISIVFVPLRLLGDPLQLRRPDSGTWQKTDSKGSGLDNFGNQG